MSEFDEDRYIRVRASEWNDLESRCKELEKAQDDLADAQVRKMEQAHVEKYFEKILDNIMKEDYGVTPNSKVVELRARLNRGCIEVFVVGKWRGIRHYGGRKGVLPSAKIMAEVERSIRCNTGRFYKDDNVFNFTWEEVKE